MRPFDANLRDLRKELERVEGEAWHKARLDGILRARDIVNGMYSAQGMMCDLHPNNQVATAVLCALGEALDQINKLANDQVGMEQSWRTR